MDDLAQRLMRAAFDAAHEQRDRDWAPFKEGGGSYDLQAFFESEHKAAVVAVLRELADGLFESLLSRVEPGMVVRPNVIPDLIRGWADSIEKGAE